MQIRPLLGAVIDLDVSYFVQLALFLLFVWLINFLLFQPLLRLFERRRQETDLREGEATRAQAEAERLSAQYGKELAAASTEGLTRRNQRRDGALRAESERLAKARAAGAVRMEEEMGRFAGELEIARAQAAPLVESLAAEGIDLLAGNRREGKP